MYSIGAKMAADGLIAACHYVPLNRFFLKDYCVVLITFLQVISK